MAIKIQKIKVLGTIVYPATVLDAVKDAKPKIVNEQGVSVDNPNLGKTVRLIIEANEAATQNSLSELSNRAGALASLTTKTKTSLVAAINEVLAALGNDANAISDLQDLVAKLDGDIQTEGSVKKQINDAIVGVVNGAPEKFDTLKEIADWIANSEDKTAADIVAAVNANTNAIGKKATDDQAATGLFKEIADARQQAIDAAIAADHAKTTVVAGNNGHITVDGTSDVTVYTHATFDAAEAAAVKIGRNSEGHVVIGDALAAGDIDATAIAASTSSVAFDGTTVADQLANAATAIKTVENAVSNKNVSAEGESGNSALVSASASGNKVTVATTTKLQNAVASAESALQSVLHGNDGAFVALTVTGKSSNTLTLSAAVTTVSTIGAPTAATGLATDKVVYDYALTCVNSSDTTEYEDVF